MKQTAAMLIEALDFLADTHQSAHLQRFFKTGKGEYGEGDLFLGIKVPETRKVAKQFNQLSFEEIDVLLHNPFHEARLCAGLILVERYTKSKKLEAEQTRIVNFYLERTACFNNWDLVDLTAPKILGSYLLTRNRSILYKLAESTLLWEQRIAMVANWTLIRDNQLDDTFKLAEKLIDHPHDLIQKAVGWMLREAAKKDKLRLEAFLKTYAATMPRTALRYSIEHFDESERKYYMELKVIHRSNNG